MAKITLDESLRQIRTLERRAEQAADKGRWADGSDRKYKKCCGPDGATPHDPA